MTINSVKTLDVVQNFWRHYCAFEYLNYSNKYPTFHHLILGFTNVLQSALCLRPGY